MNKPLTILGIILIVLGGIGLNFFIEFVLAVVFGIMVFIVGITVSSGKFSKRRIVEDPSIEFCPHCGSSITKGSNYCGYCSKKL